MLVASAIARNRITAKAAAPVPITIATPVSSHTRRSTVKSRKTEDREFIEPLQSSLLHDLFRPSRYILRRKPKLGHHDIARRRCTKPIEPNNIAIRAHILPPTLWGAGLHCQLGNTRRQHAHPIFCRLLLEDPPTRHADHTRRDSARDKQFGCTQGY